MVMIIKTNKQLFNEFDKALKINNCGLSSKAWAANILSYSETDSTLTQDSSNILWSKITKLKY
ncbi:MAG: hypothetical protein ACI9RO_001823 [Alteromonas macleodii]|jgi:hypothetical protein